MLLKDPSCQNNMPYDLTTQTVYVKRNIEARSFSSFYWASVANVPKVLQPYWLIVLPLDVPDLSASLLLWGPSSQRWRCLWTFLFSNVPNVATGLLQDILVAKGGPTWARNGRWILPENARLPLTCRDLLHVVNLRHGTDGYTSLPKEGVLRSKKSNGFGRVWTRELGYQRPARYL